MSEPTLDQVYGTLTEIGLPGMDARFHTDRLRELLAAFRAGAGWAAQAPHPETCDVCNETWHGNYPTRTVRTEP